MVDKERIYKEYSFEIDRVEGLQGKRKVAIIFTILRAVLFFVLFTVFVSLFLSIFNLFISEGGWIVYGIIGFMFFVLFFILYSNFKQHGIGRAKQIFPSLSLEGLNGTIFTIIAMLFIFASAYGVSKWLFMDTEFEKNGFDFILRWVLGIGVIIVLVILSGLLNRPILTYEQAYFEQIGTWVIKKMDPKTIFNASHQWPESISLFSSEHSEKKSMPGICMADVDTAFAGYLHQLYRVKFWDSLTMNLNGRKIDIATIQVKTKQVKKSAGKTAIEFKDVFEGTILATDLNGETLISRISTKLNEPLFLGEQVNMVKTKLNGKTLEFSGNPNVKNRSEMENIVITQSEAWNTDCTVLIANKKLFLMIYNVNLFKSLALSADLFQDEHIKKPVETIAHFIELSTKMH